MILDFTVNVHALLIVQHYVAHVHRGNLVITEAGTFVSRTGISYVGWRLPHGSSCFLCMYGDGRLA